MSHTIHKKQKLLNRVRRIRDQLNTIERVLKGEQGCAPVLWQITNRQGAMNGLLVVVLKNHIHAHLTGADDEHKCANGGIKEQLTGAVHSYFK